MISARTLIASALLLCTSLASANATTYKQSIVREELVLTKYKQPYLDLVDINRREALQSWYRLFFSSPDNKRKYMTARARLNSYVMGEEFSKLIMYYVMTGQNESAIQTLGLYLLSSYTLLESHTLDPFNVHYKSTALNALDIIEKYSIKDITSIETCVRGVLKDSKRSYDIKKSQLVPNFISSCLRSNYFIHDLNRIVEALTQSTDYRGAPHAFSFSTPIGGNKVQLLNKVPMADFAIEFLGKQLHAIHNNVNKALNKKYAEMSVEDFKSVMTSEEDAVDNIFTRVEGFANRESHYSLGPISTGTQGMFQRVLEQIDNAKESVFVDIFWMGGTIGVQLAKTLMKKTIENPEFKVVIISDEENNFDYGVQLNVAYNYMRAYSEKFPNKYFYILPANIDLKRTALPEFVDLLFTNSTINLAKKNSQLDSIYAADKFNLIGKSDHTKVVIVDGKNPNIGTAFVGSKNWTDSSGGIATDEIAEINGPAVASILNHFYYDVLEAFLQEDKKSGYVKMQIDAKLAGENVKSVHNGIQMLLEPIDILQRWSNTPVELVKIPYVEKGTAIISTAQNNIYGTETSTLDQNIQVILQAREQIIIDDQFLYDPYIAQALKAAIKLHGVKVYIMLESLTGTDPNVVMGHVPNNLFLPELVALGAEAKWKKVPDSVIKAIENVKTKYGETLAPEFHLKSITVDGIRAHETDICNSESASLKHHKTLPALITGSANKDVMTMTGGFREYQVLVYSEDAVIRHDCIFWSRWNNPSESVETNGLDFVAPPEAKQAGLDEESFLNVLRMAFFSTYNFTKDFF
jgi:phosphatidylserine/phosphatidylglycerophosphate/cardiolipin synthase-like enzyme